MRLLICGDRNYKNGAKIKGLLLMAAETRSVDVVISGHARGADKLGENAAWDLDISTAVYPAKWKEFGRAAGPIRNQQMLDEGKPDEVWAFHPNISESVGTKDMVARAKKAGIVVKEFK